MATLTEKHLQSVINTISECEDIIDSKIEYKYSHDAGSGYMGIVNAIEVKGENKTVNLIVKQAPESEKLREQIPVRETFLREIYFYEKVVPAYAKFQNERNIDSPFDSVAKCFATASGHGEELLMLDNLRTQGYEVFNRQTTMNSEHVEFVFSEYGKFHAVSYAMKDQNLEEYKELTRDLYSIVKLFYEQDNMKTMITKICDTVKVLFDEKSEIYDFYSKFSDKVIDLITNYKKDEYAVLIHGDCWCNNMMFKYDEGSKMKPTSMRLIDFQIVYEASPVFDLAYFFYVCVSKDIMENVDKYLNIYHNSLSKHLRDLGSDPEKILPYSVLLSQWKKYAYYGLAVCPMLIKVMLVDSEEAPNLANDADAGGDITDSMLFTTKHEQEYNRRVKDVVTHFYEKQYYEY